MPLWPHSLSGRTLMTPAQTELQSELMPLMLCLFFCFVFVDAENLFHVAFMYQQLAYLKRMIRKRFQLFKSNVLNYFLHSSSFYLILSMKKRQRIIFQKSSLCLMGYSILDNKKAPQLNEML